MPIDYGKWVLSLKDLFLIFTVCGAGGMAVGWLFYDSYLLGAAVSFLLLLFVPRYRKWRIAQRRATLLIQFRDLLYSVSSSISVGRSMGQALEESMDFWQGTYSQKDLIMTELASMVHRIKESNENDVEVLRDLAERSGLEDVADFAGVYENCRQSGADLVQAVNRATMIITDKISLEKELHTLMAQKKFEGRVVMLSPFAVLLFLKLFSPQYLLPLTSSFQGKMVSSLALALIVTACLMMERVNRFEI